MENYFGLLDQLVAASAVVIDRPRGSRRPGLPEVIYPLDYGHLENTTSDDGADVDVVVVAPPVMALWVSCSRRTWASGTSKPKS